MLFAGILGVPGDSSMSKHFKVLSVGFRGTEDEKSGMFSLVSLDLLFFSTVLE